MKRALVLIAAATACAAVLSEAASAKPAYGVVNQGLLSERDFQRMDKGGVGTLRFLVRRSWTEPAPGQYDWSTVDPVVAEAGERGIELLPFLYGSPPWLHDVEAHPPIDDRAERRGWQSWVTALVERYGPHGEFWAGPEPNHPIRRWQLWNEANFDFYWHPEPDPRDYAKLVSISAVAIRAADPKAKIVLGGVAPVRLGMKWWRFLERFYEAPGIKRSFDYAALHPYSPGIHVLGEYVELARRVMRQAGDRHTPLAITEIGWASEGLPGAPLVVGAEKQAALLERSFAFLSQPDTGWRISDIDWYAWQDTRAIEASCSFCEHAGLFGVAGRAKPAWAAFKRAAR